MNAEIICIGTELLLGQLINTNDSYLARKLAQCGIDVFRHSTVGDNPDRLSDCIQEALGRSNIVIATGGLGPTIDDITCRTIASATNKKLVFRENILKDIKAHFKKNKIKMPKENIRQAYIPQGAMPIKNRVGTAPGIILPHQGKLLIALPGVPGEMMPMMEKTVIPYLKRNYISGWVIETKNIKTTGLCESEVNAKIKNLLKTKPPLTLGIYAHPQQIDLKITAKSTSPKQARRMIKSMEIKVQEKLKDYIFGVDADTQESVVGKLLTKKRKTLCVAESCTGGLICDKITDVPGSSKYFAGGGVFYSNEYKISRLGVPQELFKKYGAVSSQVALSMAKGIKNSLKTDYSLSTTGICGPSGGTRKKPVGLVYIALSGPNKTIFKKFNFTGKRRIIKTKAAFAALDMLRRELQELSK